MLLMHNLTRTAIQPNGVENDVSARLPNLPSACELPREPVVPICIKIKIPPFSSASPSASTASTPSRDWGFQAPEIVGGQGRRGPHV